MFTEIQELEAKMQSEQETELEPQEMCEQSILPIKAQNELREAVRAMAEPFKGTETPVVWKHIDAVS